MADVDVGVAEGTVGDAGTSLAVHWTCLAHENSVTIIQHLFQMNPTERCMVIKYDLEVPNPSILKMYLEAVSRGFSALPVLSL